VSDGADPTSPPLTSPLDERQGRKLSSITLSEEERSRLIDSIDRQLAELEGRAAGTAAADGGG
jgi:hypothetical protein